MLPRCLFVGLLALVLLTVVVLFVLFAACPSRFRTLLDGLARFVPVLSVLPGGALAGGALVRRLQRQG